MIILIIIGVILAVIILVSIFNKRKFVKMFSRGNVIVSGLRGQGKDLAFCVVINARKKPYVSNVQYTDNKKIKWYPFKKEYLTIGGNTYKDFTDGTVKPYKYPLPDGVDFYISDSGVYLPSTYCNDLVKQYPEAPLFMALSRHLGDCNVHNNVQNVNRLWDKFREQSDIYIQMDGSKVFFGKIAVISAWIYERQESCEKRIKPPYFGLFGKAVKDRRIAFEIAHGRIDKISFICLLPYKYDSRIFKTILEKGV